jgi:predicted ATP-dependent endonuclease of OLD family
VRGLLDSLVIHGYRSAREVTLHPGPICALVGESASGKSTVLRAIWSLLEASAPVPTAADASHGGDGRILVEGTTGGRTLFLDARPPGTLNLNRGGAPPVVFLPAELRGTSLVGPTSTPGAQRAAGLVEGTASLVAGIERLCDRRVRGVIVLIEEPELYLGPQAQRHLYRLLRRLAANGNQVLYTTHAPIFLSVDRLDEVALVRHRDRGGTELVQPQPLGDKVGFRAFAEFDAERAELFLARAALLVEGRTEKLVLPFVFESLGYDADREAIAIIACGGKSNIPLFAEVCNECRIPYVVLHDRDAPEDEEPKQSEQIVNAVIAEVAGPERTIVLVPDFEAVAGVKARYKKPARAWRRFSEANAGRVPEPLAEAVEQAVAAARGRKRRRRREQAALRAAAS